MAKMNGQVIQWEWKGKAHTISFTDVASYRNKKEFVETLAHEMIHLWQMNHKAIQIITNYFIHLDQS